MLLSFADEETLSVLRRQSAAPDPRSANALIKP